MDKKILFFDIDGTLMDEKTKEFPVSALNAIKKVKDKGHMVFINTGRVSCILGDIVDITNADGALCGCGTQLIVKDKTIMEYRIPKERIKKLKEDILKYDIEVVFEAQEAHYYPKKPYKHPEILNRIYEFIKPLSKVYEDSFDKDFNFDKFLIISKNSSVENIEGFIETLSDFNVIGRGNGFYECVPKPYTKGTAIEYILNYFNVSEDNAYVFGDSMNDLEMFTSGVKHKILMGKHDKELEQFATFITKDVLDDGIAYAINKLNIAG